MDADETTVEIWRAGEGRAETVTRSHGDVPLGCSGEVDRAIIRMEKTEWTQLEATLADAYAFAGEREEALRWLGRAVDIGFCNAPFLADMNEHLTGLRNDPEFQEILEKARRGQARMRTLVEGRGTRPPTSKPIRW